MSLKSLEAFLAAGLHGSLPIAGDYSTLPSAFLLELFRQLDPSVRQAFEDLLIKSLGDLAQNPASIWRSDAGDELLLLIGSVFANSHRASDPVDLLLYMVEQDWQLRDAPLNLHWRAVQTLIGIEYRAQPGFWLRVSERGGIEYAGLVLAGLSLTSLEDALEWLGRQATDDRVWDEFIAIIPLLVEKYGVERLVRRFRRNLSRIPKNHISEFSGLIADLGGPVTSDVLFGLDAKRLRELANELQLQFPEKADESALRGIIEEFLRIEAEDRHEYSSMNPDIELISAIADFIADRGPVLTDFRDYFVQRAEQIYQGTDLGADALRFAEQVDIIRQYGVNVIDQISHAARGFEND